MWSIGPNKTPFRSFSTNQTGKYILTVEDSAGCKASDSLYLSIIDKKIINKQNRICYGDSVAISLSNSLTWNEKYRYKWNTGDTTNVVPPIHRTAFG